MAVLTVQAISRTGLAPALTAAAAAGDSFPNTGRVFFVVKNSGTQKTLTVVSQIPAGAIPQGATKTDLTVTVPATTGEKWIGPFDPAFFNDANGRVVCTYDSETGLTVGAFSL